MKKALIWFVSEFLTRVVMEFIWFIFSAAIGVMVASEFGNLDFGIVWKSYRVGLILVVFNAALIRVVMYYGLTWLDKQISPVAQDQLDTARRMVTWAVTYLRKDNHPTEPEPAAADQPQE